jgi:hypothetical protein
MKRINSTVGAFARMSHFRSLLVAGLVGLTSSVVDGFGQTGQTDVTPTLKTPERDGRVILSDQQAAENNLLSIDRQKLPLEIKERLRRFEVVREAYLKEQDLLRRRLTGAVSEEERDRIRALIKASQEAWLARARALREEARERIQELKALTPSRSEVLNDALDKARDVHRRRGRD